MFKLSRNLVVFPILFACTSCGNNQPDLSALLSNACFKVNTAINLNWNNLMTARRGELLLEASAIFKEASIQDSSYLKYVEISGIYSKGVGAVPTADRDALIGFCSTR